MVEQDRLWRGIAGGFYIFKTDRNILIQIYVLGAAFKSQVPLQALKKNKEQTKQINKNSIVKQSTRFIYDHFNTAGKYLL
jgi:hypothetical protein